MNRRCCGPPSADIKHASSPCLRQKRTRTCSVLRYAHHFSTSFDVMISQGESPFLWAAVGAHLETLDLLLKYGASPDPRNIKVMYLMKLLFIVVVIVSRMRRH